MSRSLSSILHRRLSKRAATAEAGGALIGALGGGTVGALTAEEGTPLRRRLLRALIGAVGGGAVGSLAGGGLRYLRDSRALGRSLDRGTAQLDDRYGELGRISRRLRQDVGSYREVPLSDYERLWGQHVGLDTHLENRQNRTQLRRQILRAMGDNMRDNYNTGLDLVRHSADTGRSKRRRNFLPRALTLGLYSPHDEGSVSAPERAAGYRLSLPGEHPFERLKRDWAGMRAVPAPSRRYKDFAPGGSRSALR